MPVADYYIDAGSMDAVVVALKKSRGGTRDLRMAYRNIAEDAGRYVRAHAPVGRSSKKDSRQHAIPGRTRRSVRYGSTINGPWVSAGDESTPDIYLQEFGGTSYWYRGGGMHGQIRQFDTEGGRSYKHKRRTLVARDLGSIAKRYGLGGHVVYTKPRNRMGYFIWNVAFRLRSRIGENLQENLSLVLQKHGIPYEMPSNPELGIGPQLWEGAA